MAKWLQYQKLTKSRWPQELGREVLSHFWSFKMCTPGTSENAPLSDATNISEIAVIFEEASACSHLGCATIPHLASARCPVTLSGVLWRCHPAIFTCASEGKEILYAVFFF